MSRIDSSANAMLKELTDLFGRRALAYAVPPVTQTSTRLGKAMKLIREAVNKAKLFIPHYWAIYVHDGRGPFGVSDDSEAAVLVWFKNPKDDPRQPTPERRSQVRRLTKEQFRDGLAQNRLAEIATYGRPRRRGEKQVGPMVIASWVSFSKTGNIQPGKFFFGNEPGQGMSGFLNSVRPEAKQLVQERMRTVLGEGFFQQRRQVVSLRL